MPSTKLYTIDQEPQSSVWKGLSVVVEKINGDFNSLVARKHTDMKYYFYNNSKCFILCNLLSLSLI